MKLTDAFFHGHNHLVTAPDGMLTPYRFTPERLAYYAAENEMFSPRAHNSSGISLAFTTSADEFSMDVAFTNEVRNENSLTVYEDGRLAQIISLSWDEPKTKFFYRKKCGQAMGKVCRYEIYLPAMATISLQNLSAEDAQPIAKQPKQLLTLGDSITQGVYCQASANAYTVRLARHLGMELCNQGVGGYYFNPNAFEHEADPSIITVAYGINDLTRTEYDAPFVLQNAEASFQKILAVYPDVPVFCMTPLWRADFKPEQVPAYEVLTEGLLALCKTYGLHAINGSEVFPQDATLFTDGYLHPNDVGFAIMAEAFAKAIDAAL